MKVHHSRVHDESIAGKPVNCTDCGAELRRPQSEVRRQETFFCNRKCQASWQSNNWSGDDSPRSTLKEVKCAVCGDTLMLPRWQRNQSDYFLCSEPCRSIKQYERLYEGYSTDYGKEWYKARKETRERFSHKCIECGEVCEDRHHDVHHIVPVKEFDNPNEAHYESNLLLLCQSCHKHVESLSKRRQRDRL